MFEIIEPFDFAVLDFIRENIACRALDGVMYIITTAGDAGMIWIAAALAMLASKKYRHVGIALAIGLILMHFTGNVLLKSLIARPRPFVADPSVQLFLPPPNGYSFPSGHSFASGVGGTVIALGNKKLGIIAVAMALLIGFSRLYFYVHFPSDVICGLLFGALLGTAVYLVCRKKLLPAQSEEC